MDIIEIKNYSESVLNSVNFLLPQLSKTAGQLDRESLERIINSETSKLLFAIEEEEVFAMLTLVVFETPTSKRAWVEDVVVSEAARGKGVGQLISEAAIEVAFSLGVKNVNLTTHASREAANILYQKIGFERRETNVYRYTQYTSND